jgi:uncharacterized protein YjbI with pentapeptide repeats
MADELRPDVQAARDEMTVRFGTSREIDKLGEHLWDPEHVAHLAKAAHGNVGGLLVLTDRRLLFLKEGRRSQTAASFPLETISSAHWSSGLMTGKLTVTASGNEVVITEIEKPEGSAIVATLNRFLAGAPAPPPDPAPGTGFGPQPTESPPSAPSTSSVTGGSGPSQQEAPPAQGEQLGCLTGLAVVAAVPLAVWAVISHTLWGGIAGFVVGVVGAAVAAASWLSSRRQAGGPGAPRKRPVGIAIAGLAALAVGSIGLGQNAWYRWVSCAPEPAADLVGCDLAGRDLDEVDLNGADLTGANLTSANLTGADMEGADLSGAALAGAVLSSANLAGSNLAGLDLTPVALDGVTLAGADLTGTTLATQDLSQVDLSGSTLRDATLTEADLTGANLSEADLAEADLTSAVLDTIDLTTSGLTGTVLAGTSLAGTNLAGHDLSGLDLSDANLTDADLAGTILSQADLAGATLVDATATRAAIDRADLAGADLSGADLSGADLTDADLSSVNLTSTILPGANLDNANLTGATLTGARLAGASLSGANLADLDLSGLDLSSANLAEADLTDADLSGTDLTEVDFTSANLSDADLTDATAGSILLTGADLEGVEGMSDADTAAGLGVTLDELAARLIADNQRLESRAATIRQLGEACTTDTAARVDYAVADSVAVLDGAGAEAHGFADVVASELGLTLPPAARMATLVVCVGEPEAILVETCEYSTTGFPPFTNFVERYRHRTAVKLVDLRGFPDRRVRQIEVDGETPGGCPEFELFDFGSTTEVIRGEEPDALSVAAAVQANL